MSEIVERTDDLEIIGSMGKASEGELDSIAKCEPREDKNFSEV